MLLTSFRARERRVFEKTLLSTHELRVRVRLQTLDGDDVSDLTDNLLDGQVNVDVTGTSDRNLSITLSDPRHQLNLDSDSASDGAIYLDRMLRVDYRVWVGDLGQWCDVPVFTGPIVTMSRTGAEIELSCLGKEHLAQGVSWRPLTIKKGHNTVDAIRVILRERAGETRFAFPELKHRLARPVSLARMEQPWVKAQRLANALDRQLYYDGAGICRLRRIPKQASFTFRDGDGGSVLSDPQVSYDLSNVRNVVWVKGGKPKGHQGRNTGDDKDNRDGGGAALLASGHQPYDHVTVDGETLDWLTNAQLKVMQNLSGVTVTIIQGSYTTGVPQSGGTHAGGGTIDVSPNNGNYASTVAAMRRAGFAAWHRTPSQGDWGHHIHAVSIFSRNAASGAKGQVQSYLTNTGDGLGGRPYGPRVSLYPHLRQRMAAYVDIAHSGDVIDDDNNPQPRGKEVPDHEVKPVTGFAIAPRAHALSPWRLGREDAPRYLVEQIERSQVRTRKAAVAAAQNRLDNLLLEGIAVSFDCLPIPFLEPYDRVRVTTDSTSLTFVLRQYSLPLLHSGVMSIGANRRVTPSRRRVRGRAHRR